MISRANKPVIWISAGVGFLIGGLTFVGYVLTGSIDLVDRNCQRIELLKRVGREAFEEDIRAAEKFLRKNPEGIPGISPEFIREGIERDERTVARLIPEKC